MVLFGRKTRTPAPPSASRYVMVSGVALPAWARLRQGPAADIAPRPIVDVDAGGMYAALLGELRGYYAANTPGEFLDGEGKLKPEWKVCLAELNEDPTTCYWLESAYQCGKMELQIAMKTFAFEIHIHDTEHEFAQKKHKTGRGAQRAAGGMQGGREAREHFKRLRGFIPS